MIVHEEKSFAVRSVLFFSYFKELIFLETAMWKISEFCFAGKWANTKMVSQTTGHFN
jgi:hypothetical protein